MAEWLSELNPLWLSLIRVALLVGLILTIVPGLIWWERRLLSWFQDRIGPNRTGPFGLLQPIADGIKLFLKEDITPAMADRSLYFIAPVVALFPAFVLGATLPFAPQVGAYAYLTPLADVDIGLLLVLAVSSIGVYGVVLAGYASNNKYSLLGGLRASAQLLSYELGMGVSLACIVLAAGSLKMTELVAAQEEPWMGLVPALQNWFLFTPFGLVSGVVFLICIVAETNRAPFDLPEAENELIAGYHTEYSSMKFAVFFMGEYAAMFIFSGIFAAVFLGGYNLLPLNWDWLAANVPALSGFFATIGKLNVALAPLWMIGKCMLGISVYVWIRATLPRLRYDQLMSLGWKWLLPLAAANFIVVALWILCVRLYGPLGGLASVAAAGVILVLLYLNFIADGRSRPRAFAPRTVRLTEGSGGTGALDAPRGDGA